MKEGQTEVLIWKIAINIGWCHHTFCLLIVVKIMSCHMPWSWTLLSSVLFIPRIGTNRKRWRVDKLRCCFEKLNYCHWWVCLVKIYLFIYKFEFAWTFINDWYNLRWKVKSLSWMILLYNYGVWVCLGKGSKKKSKKKLTNVSFVCVCVGRKWSNVSFFFNFFLPTIIW